MQLCELLSFGLTMPNPQRHIKTLAIPLRYSSSQPFLHSGNVLCNRARIILDILMPQKVLGVDPFFHFTGVFVRSIRSIKWR